MDSTDQRLLNLVASNPRAHLQELAEKLGISKQAVYHRMQSLMDAGVIKGTTAGISFAYLKAVPVAIFGRSNAAPVEGVMDKLGKSEFTRRVIVAGGNYVYVVGELRNVSELDGYAQFVKNTADMPEPIVGIYCLDDVPMPDYNVDGLKVRKRSYKELSHLDLKIIASLKNDARRPTTDIAETVGASTKTVKRRLDSMISDESLELHTIMDSPLGGKMLTLMHVTLRSGAHKGEVAMRLLSKNPSLDGYARTFVDVPSLVIVVFWSGDLRETRSIFRETSKDEDVLAVTLNFGYLERIYETTWRDKLLEAWVQGDDEGGIRRRPRERGHS